MTAGVLALIHKFTGSLLVLFGIVVLPMPIPLGLILILLGLGLLAPYFLPIQAFIRHLRRKYPKVDETMIKLKHRCPPVMKTTIEKTCPKRYDESQAA
ncbi:MAG: PGPGW domain-containing protein [Pseudomonadota bacterium]